jgi:hypothetical protein
VRIGDTLEDIDEVPNSSIVQEKAGKVDFLIFGSFTLYFSWTQARVDLKALTDHFEGGLRVYSFDPCW